MHEGKAGGAILYHEDIEVGTPLMLGSTTVTKDAIVAFARAYDPQPIHLDEEAAKTSIVGGLCASGYHTCAIMMRMLVHGFLGRAASQGSPGVDEVRWLKPVRPGEAVRTRFTPLEKRVLGSRPDVGITKVLVELIDGQDQVLASWLTNQLTRLRTPGSGAGANLRRKSGEKSARQSLGRCDGRCTGLSGSPLRGPPDRRDDRYRQPHLQPGRHRRLRQPVRPAAVPSRRGGRQGLAVRRAVRVGLADGGLPDPRHHHGAAAGQCGGAGAGRRAGDLRAVARLPQSALAEAGVRRRHHRVSHAPGRQGRPEVAPRARPAGERGARPQPARGCRVRHHHADAGRAAAALV